VRPGRAAPVIRRAGPRPGASASPDPGDGEEHQHHQAERDARGDHTQPQPGHVGGLMLGQEPHDHARRYHDEADHDRHGSRHGQDDD
jgi:hypothetical protein